jgi:hypothetical protein
MRLFFLRFFFFPSLGCFARFFLSRFWAFRNKGSSKTRLKKSREFGFPQPPKKVLKALTTYSKLTDLRHFFFCAPAPSLGTTWDSPNDNDRLLFLPDKQL